MNREEARLELDATTLRPQDTSPEAREMARTDPELGAWLERRTAFDESVAEAFQGMTVPSDLRAGILRAAKPPSLVRRRVAWLTSTLAAAAACLAFGWTLLWPGNSAMAAWESDSLSAVAKVEYGVARLDEKAANFEAVRQLLNARDCPCPNAVPKALAKLRTHGCKHIQVDGRPATLICFELEPGKEAHLVVFNNADLCDCPGQGQPCFKSSKNWRYASWSHGEQAFVLATRADEATLKTLFAAR
ncbi:MAG: hypothetical protein ACO1TE_22675 [Prosthecobacter sp.]